jgi:hypothetical protein
MAGKERWVTHQALVNGRRSATQENHDRRGSLEQAAASTRGVQTLLQAGLLAGFDEEEGVRVVVHIEEHHEQRKNQKCHREEKSFLPFAPAQRKGRGRLWRRQQLADSEVLFSCKAPKFSGIRRPNAAAAAAAAAAALFLQQARGAAAEGGPLNSNLEPEKTK